MRDVLSRLAMIVVLVAGLLGLAVAASARPAVDERAWAVTGGAVGDKCYINGEAPCDVGNIGNNGLKLCLDHPCSPDGICPVTAAHQIWNTPSTYDRAERSGVTGKQSAKQSGVRWCKIETPCLAAGTSDCKVGVNRGGVVDLYCAGGGNGNARTTDPRVMTVPDGGDCPDQP